MPQNGDESVNKLKSKLVPKTYRLAPELIDRIAQLAHQHNMSISAFVGYLFGVAIDRIESEARDASTNQMIITIAVAGTASPLYVNVDPPIPILFTDMSHNPSS